MQVVQEIMPLSAALPALAAKTQSTPSRTSAARLPAGLACVRTTDDRARLRAYLHSAEYQRQLAVTRE